MNKLSMILTRLIKSDVRINGNVTELSRLTGVPQPTILRLKNGDIVDPREKTLQPLARFFGITVTQLRGGENSEPIDNGLIQHKITLLPIIEWYDIDRYISSINSSKDYKKMPFTEAVSANAYAIEVADAMYHPYTNKGEMIVVEPDLDTLNRICLINLNSSHTLMKHIRVERDYLQAVDGSMLTIPMDDANDCQFLGVITHIIATRNG